ncbi:hypothetical protein T12_10934 [Trichinella patagoniensis]|uniref:Uncharacterized protein n=1 Tax=Trichinella patagoniensis TaxID=990121 RepID=A0A0V0Z2T3_9BILA|nr:hypothetical protein T12_10479 [Trichinella patagoniensis]KRY06841.1 hypothetical protein T12_10934 [Trichinella patagoniensis]
MGIIRRERRAEKGRKNQLKDVKGHSDNFKNGS